MKSADENRIFQDLLNACRNGDLELVERLAFLIPHSSYCYTVYALEKRTNTTLNWISLVRNFGAPINQTDTWQCSPLYLACLCGHYREFLLENGARCGQDTFEGQRCYYGALTIKIRSLLSSYKYTKADDKYQPFRKFFSHILERPLDTFSDVIFKLNAPYGWLRGYNTLEKLEISAHRSILYARSTFFASKFQTIWRTSKVIEIQEIQIHPTCFRTMLRYLYTGEITSIPNSLMDNMIQLCQYVCLNNLAERYKNKRINQDLDKVEFKKLQNDLVKFFKNVLLEDKQYYVETDYNNKMEFTESQHDICIRVEDEYFNCHKVFLTERCEYFKAMFTGPFSEKLLRSPRVSDCSSEVFALILEFIYTDKCDIPESLACEVLIKADMYLLDKLKSIASIVLTKLSEPLEDIYVLMRTAIDLNIVRLEQWCCRWFAEHLHEVIEDQRFLDFICESAHSIKKRQETDTIPFIDDLRYWLSKKYSVLEDDIDKRSGKVREYDGEEITDWEAEYNLVLEKIEQVLLSLDLNA
ncbi:12620_t:CDS:2 [Funneliformis geosporum]|uniref:18809_t:CDS:1 n=1 Tax=Funneliformis geosporum TaxID=1117311 RepID=A0A9W4SLW3_9GLOM|nr:18809_t:CDS:2 [Funneliformis geosporum]CAI2172055.1 12620_t:CDS:2 [Funneliformis geosporum]